MIKIKMKKVSTNILESDENSSNKEEKVKNQDNIKKG